MLTGTVELLLTHLSAVAFVHDLEWPPVDDPLVRHHLRATALDA